MTIETQIVFWAWVIVCGLDVIAGMLCGLELWKENKPGANRMAHILFSTAYRSFATIVGLSLFGLNVRAQHWFLWLGFSAVLYKAYSTWSWFALTRGWINGGGWRELLKRKK